MAGYVAGLILGQGLIYMWSEQGTLQTPLSLNHGLGTANETTFKFVNLKLGFSMFIN